MEGLSIILADSALEPVPQELSNHPTIRKYRTLYKKHSDNILLDKSFHSPCMKLLPDNEKRGRPDIVHLSLISLTSSPLYLEKKLKVYVHTVSNSVIDINFGVRLPKSYSRFSSLMEQLFSIKTIIKDNSTLLSLRTCSFQELIKDINPDLTIALTRKGRFENIPKIIAQLSDYLRPVIVIGGFSHGSFSKDIEANSDYIYSISRRKLESHLVCSRIVYEFEKIILSDYG